MKAPDTPITEVDQEVLERLLDQGRATVAGFTGGMERAVQPYLSRLQTLLFDIQGMPAAAWLRMAQDEFARTQDVVWAHIARSGCARSGMAEPFWVAPALLEQSHAISDELLKPGLNKGPEQKNKAYRAVRDFRLAREIVRLEKTKKISRKGAFKQAAKLLPAKMGRGYSAETTKRAWRRVASERSFNVIYKPR